MKLFFCCMTSPVQINNALVREVGMSREDLFVHPMGARLSQDADLKAQAKAAKVIVIFSYQDFVAQLKLFNAYPKTVILLAPVLHTLRFHGESIEYLDTTPAEVTTQQTHRFHNLNVDRLKTHDWDGIYTSDYVVTMHDEEYLPKLIDAVRQGSLLNSLMTVIYRIGKAATQKLVKNACVRWMVEDGADYALLATMVQECGVSEASTAKVVQVIKDNGATHLEIIANLRKAKAAKEEDGTLKVDAKQIERKYPEFDLYELRYVLKIYAQLPYDQHIAGKTLHEIYYSRPRNAGKAAKA